MALDYIGLTGADFTNLVSLLAACLVLSNIEFAAQKTDFAEGSVPSDMSGLLFVSWTYISFRKKYPPAVRSDLSRR